MNSDDNKLFSIFDEAEDEFYKRLAKDMNTEFHVIELKPRCSKCRGELTIGEQTEWPQGICDLCYIPRD